MKIFSNALSIWYGIMILSQSIGDSMEDCPFDNDDEYDFDEDNLYDKEDNLLLTEINRARLLFFPCDNENCSCFTSVIKQDLKPFKDGITRAMIEEARDKGVKYQLINHRLYRERDCMFPSRCSGIEHFINELRYELDNFEVIINPRDWPQVSRYHNSNPVPVFSFSKTKEYYDIMYPAWSFWEGGPAISIYPRGLGRWDQHIKSLTKEAAIWPWDMKRKMVFFRGSRTSNERDILVLMSRKDPEFIDAAYTKNQAWKSIKDTLGDRPVEEATLEDHCRFKYLFNFRGVAASFRFRHLFLCRSLVFHVGSEWEEFFYQGLTPYIHYVPISKNATEKDYRFVLDFFTAHDEIAAEIAKAGQEFILQNLRMSDISCYWKFLLQQYTELLKFKPVLDDELIDVTK